MFPLIKEESSSFRGEGAVWRALTCQTLWFNYHQGMLEAIKRQVKKEAAKWR